MKVLLIFPPSLETVEPFASAPQKPIPFLWGFPIGLGYLASYLERTTEHEVQILDCLQKKYTLPEIQERIKAQSPDLVGITILTPLARSAVAVAKLVKEVSPQIITIGGGPHATYDYVNLLQNYHFDYVVLGEGEITFTELVNYLAGPTQMRKEKILGIAYRDKEGKIVNTDPRPPIEDLDALPFPARHLVNFKEYIVDGLLPRALEIMGSRGCSHRCIFCSSSHFFGRWRARSPENIIAELQALIQQYPQIKSFLFYDDNFTLNPQRVIKLCRLLIQNGLNHYQWNCLARVDQVNQEMLKLMKRAGCQKISYGIESGSPQILKNINKHLNLETACQAIRATKQAGIEALAFFMIGNPGETRATIKESIKFAQKLNPTSTLWGITQIYPGTGLAQIQGVENFVEYFYQPELTDPSPFTYICVPTFTNPGLDREEAKKIYKRIFRYFTLYHFCLDPIGRLRHFLVSPQESMSFLFNLFKK